MQSRSTFGSTGRVKSRRFRTALVVGGRPRDDAAGAGDGRPGAFPASAPVAISDRYMEHRAASVAAAHDELASLGGVPEAARVMVIVDREDPLGGIGVGHESARRIRAVPGGSGVDVTRHTSAPGTGLADSPR